MPSIIYTTLYKRTDDTPGAFPALDMPADAHTCCIKKLIGAISCNSHVVLNVKESLSLGCRTGFYFIIIIFQPSLYSH